MPTYAGTPPFVKKSYAYAYQGVINYRPLAQRLSVALFLTVSVALIFLSRSESDIAKTLRVAITDVVVPVVDVASKPVDSAKQAGLWLADIATIHSQNVHLKEMNANLMQWQHLAKQMEAENAALKKLLNYAPAQQIAFISSKIVADTSGPYVKSALINSGSKQGVRPNLAAMNDTGLVGRVVEVGNNSARILLLTDINSRIPVMTETTRERSILAGENSELASLLYLADGERVQVGERIVTSGDGGMFPAGLPVGIVTEAGPSGVKVMPLVDWQHLEYIKVVDFNF